MLLSPPLSPFPPPLPSPYARLNAFTISPFPLDQQGVDIRNVGTAVKGRSAAFLNIPPGSEIGQAMKILAKTRNLPEDEQYLRSLGVNIVFHSGQEALDLIQRRHSHVIFGDLGDPAAHAQFLSRENTLMINRNYRGDFSKPTLYAIAAAIYHEAGHLAGSGDEQTSIQEEVDCLALNTLAYRAHVAQDPEYGRYLSSSRLLSDGVALYPKLFFDKDPGKKALINRITQKYGTLPLSSQDHPVPYLPAGQIPLAIRVWNQKKCQTAREYPEIAPYERRQLIQPNLLKPVASRTAFVPDMQFQWYYPDSTRQTIGSRFQASS